jgi:type II secretory ATPase GspE/PulE/Tfp pilus assembly ATPase PilB-like protein
MILSEVMENTVDPREQEETQAKAWAAKHQFYYVDTRIITDITPLVGVMDVKDMRSFHIVPVGISHTTINIGFTAATDQGRLQFIKQKFPHQQCQFSAISETSYSSLVNAIDLAGLQSASTSSLEDFKKQIVAATGETAFRMLAQIAYQMDASDIHIEPRSEIAKVRFRIDGALHPIMDLPIERFKVFLSAVQTTAHMQWGTDKPQQGRITEELLNPAGEKTTVSIRLETVPTYYGEELIARILSMDVKFLNLENMGLASHLQAKVNEVINHPHGMILTVGPTGSGKTSMLYAIINKVNRPELKVVTLEDPVEYVLDNTSQIPVHSEDSELFSEKFRAVMRQDPDVIMLGEIRDMDTAKTALQSSLTGHLVLSTFHANSAAAALSRLMDMIGQNPLLGSALRLVMAQRLIRTLCEDCKEAFTPDEKQLAEISGAMESVPKNIFKMPESVTLYKAKGCEKCNDFGYQGRVAIIEQLSMTPEMQKFIAKGTAEITSHAIEDMAVKDGMITLLQDGLMRALAGKTTTEEVYRSVDS